MSQEGGRQASHTKYETEAQNQSSDEETREGGPIRAPVAVCDWVFFTDLAGDVGLAGIVYRGVRSHDSLQRVQEVSRPARGGRSGRQAGRNRRTRRAASRKRVEKCARWARRLRWIQKRNARSARGSETFSVPYRARRGSGSGARPSGRRCRVRRNTPGHYFSAVVFMGAADCVHGRVVEIPCAPDRCCG